MVLLASAVNSGGATSVPGEDLEIGEAHAVIVGGISGTYWTGACGMLGSTPVNLPEQGCL